MKKFKLKHWINYILILALAIPFTVMAFTGSVKGSTSLMLAQIGYSIILAVSLNLVVGFLGELSLGHAGFMCAGAYIGCFTANYLHTVIPNPTVVLILSMIVGGFTAAVFGLIIGLPTLRLKGDYLAIVTLAFGEIIRTVFMNQEVFGGALGLTTRKYGKTLFVIVFVMAIFTVFVTQNLMKSKHGRAIQAIRDNEIAARAMGVNVTYYKLAVFVIAAFFAGIAGGVLLLVAGSSVFETLVPWFILIGTILFFFAPALRQRMMENTGREQAHIALYMLALAGATFYCGYFSAGAGMIILAIMALMTNVHLGDALALKAVMVLVANVAASLVFIIQGRVLWPEAIAMGIGAFLGGFIAPKLQRFIPEFWLRVFVIIGGVLLAAWLFLRNLGVTI